MITRRQLLGLGFHSKAIEHRLARGRLHPSPWRGVYAVGRRELTQAGTSMAAVPASGPDAGASHRAAARLWRLRAAFAAGIDISVPALRHPRPPGVLVHRRADWDSSRVVIHDGIPVTTPVQTLIDLATCSLGAIVERAINDADRQGLIDPESLRAALDDHAGEPGVAVVRAVLDRPTFTLTDSELERRFVPIALAAGLPMPLTQERVNGFRVDFYWPDLGLVVETDGLRYHRTAAQQTADRRRDQAHAAAGLTALRFSRAQVAFDADEVGATLRRVAARLGARSAIRAPGRRPRAG